ncbi:hypothetical protein DT019_33415 [Streptomyces sp. SDr-06]|uniref:hypothetical protein n=1 Tax=Streptomyces sp. SDr-06 TaxID=2267702 RepID=UPI000DE981C5|nr:hypothetical protein [Streptomyces sp. SDr-06]RCH64434.1 hypothetical protein DT019_33415 [Streptomyces sp. SDr-06]
MSKDVIEPGGIPMFTGNLEQLTKDAAALTKQAGAFRDGGANVHNEFQGLSSCYHAPEADQLFATTLPVKTKADDFAGGLEKAAAALTEYEGVVRPLVAKLASLRTEAFAFTDSIAGDDHWRRDQKKIDHNERLMNEVGATIAAFTDAERACHDKITALVNGSKLTVDDGSHKPGMYGYSADALQHAEETPWGGHAEREYTGLSWVWHQVKSFVWDGFIVDGIWGTVKGLGTLVGTDGWDKAGQAWTGLAKLATGLAISSTPFAAAYWTAPDKDLPSWLRDSRTAVKETGKALVAWDEWGKNPARAAGGVTFNVLTTVFTGGSGSAAKGGAVAKVLSVTGKVAKVVDPMTYVAKAGKFGIIKVGDLFTGLKNITNGHYADIFANGGKVNLDGTFPKTADLPTIKGNYVEWPGGSRLNLDDGKVYKPDGTLSEAKVELSADDIARLKSSLPHVGETVPAGVKEPVLVGAGDRAGHLGDHPANPGTRAPGGTAHDLGRGATNDLDRGATGGSRGGTPSTGDTAGHTAGHTADAGGHGGHGAGGHDGGSGGHDGGAGGHGGGSGDEPPTGGHGGSGPHPNYDGPSRWNGASAREIMDHQVQRARHEPGYFEKYYKDYKVSAYRKYSNIPDESGLVPPQLVKHPTTGEWIAKSDEPPPIPEKYVPGADVKRDASTVVTPKGREILDQAARDRHASVSADNAIHPKVNDAKKLYEAHPTPENLEAWNEAKAEHAPLHEKMTKDTEAFGEAVARHHVIPEHYPDAKWETLDGPKNGNDQFDQVWKRDDGRFVVVEAKSSLDTELGQRRLPNGFNARQGSREYFEDILNEMKERGRTNPNERRLYRELSKALKQGKIDYILVKGNPKAGTYAGYSMRRFNLG